MENPDVPPAVLLLVEELRRSSDALRSELVGAQKETTAAVGVLSNEMRQLRATAPGRLSAYLAAGVMALALVSILGLLSFRGVDVREVTDAARVVQPPR